MDQFINQYKLEKHLISTLNSNYLYDHNKHKDIYKNKSTFDLYFLCRIICIHNFYYEKIIEPINKVLIERTKKDFINLGCSDLSAFTFPIQFIQINDVRLPYIIKHLLVITCLYNELKENGFIINIGGFSKNIKNIELPLLLDNILSFYTSNSEYLRLGNIYLAIYNLSKKTPLMHGLTLIFHHPDNIKLLSEPKLDQYLSKTQKLINLLYQGFDFKLYGFND